MTETNGTRPQVGADDVELGLSDALRVLVARKWIVLGIALVVAVAAVFSASRQPTTYSSRASILVTTAANSDEAAQLLATEKQLARSRPVAEIVAEDLELSETPEELVDQLTVSVPLGTQLLEFSYAAPTPEDATKIAQGFVDAFRKYQAGLLDGLIASTQSLDDQIDTLRSQLVDAQASLSTAQSPAEISAVTTEMNSLDAQISTLEQKRTTLLTSAPVGSTISERAAPAEEDAPPYRRAAVLGFLAGLVLGAFVAYGLEFRSRRRDRRSNSTPDDSDQPVHPIGPADIGSETAQAFGVPPAWHGRSFQPRQQG